jgi:hypothetical protein
MFLFLDFFPRNAGALSEDSTPKLLIFDSDVEHLHSCHSPVGFGAARSRALRKPEKRHAAYCQ